MLPHPFPFAVGIGVLTFLAFDLFQTITQSSEGPASRLSQMAVQRVLTWLYRLTDNRIFLVWSTSLLIVSLVSMWITLLYLGWFLVFSGDPRAVLRATDQSPALLGERVYFTGFTISTLGVGDYIPNGAFWQFLTTLAAISGFFFLTFTISFLLSVTDKQALRRKLALNIHHLGQTPQEIVIRHWKQAESKLGENVLDPILPDLIQFEQQHLDQPILNRLHGPSARTSVELALAMFDEALTLAEYAADVALPSQFLHARTSITSFLNEVQTSDGTDPDEVPPIPDLRPLKDAGIPLRQVAEIEAGYSKLRQRRNKLIKLVRSSGWEWTRVEARAHVHTD